eukprot:4576131-Pyramimonas_sp.AAC.2
MCRNRVFCETLLVNPSCAGNAVDLSRVLGFDPTAYSAPITSAVALTASCSLKWDHAPFALTWATDGVGGRVRTVHRANPSAQFTALGVQSVKWLKGGARRTKDAV